MSEKETAGNAPEISKSKLNDALGAGWLTVAELINFLQQQPQNLPVAYYRHSEQCLLQTSDIEIREFCLPRPDGWIQDKRPDMTVQQYLIFPGN